MKLKKIIKRKEMAVSPVIAIIIMVCLVIAVIAPVYILINNTMKKPDAEGFWSLLNNGLPDEETDGGDGGSIFTGLGCPCDMLIVNTGNNKKIGYTTVGPTNRILCEEMENASLLSDDGVEERYSIAVRSNEVNNLIYQITCFDNGEYTFTVEYTASEETRSVVATQIDIEKDEVHKYQINWGSRPPTVTLWIDKGGDSDFETEITKETDSITNQMIEDEGEGQSEDGYQLSVTVEITDIIQSPLTRCITFDLWDCSTMSSKTLDQEITFINGIGSALIPVSSGDYTCISARDKLHTLRQTDESLEKVGNQYIADFTGADALVSGNLNDDQWIDILDFGVYSWQYGHDYGTGDTDCSTAYPHADLNGDGIVDSSDFTILRSHFLEGSEAECCS